MNIFKWLTPKLSELTTYQSALIILGLLFVRQDFLVFILSTIDDFVYGYHLFSPFLLTIYVCSILGISFSILHVFTQSKKSEFEKTVIGIFAISANGWCGLAAGFELFPIYHTSWSILSIIPLWNIFWATVILIRLPLPFQVIPDDNASPLEVIIGTGIVILAFLIVNYAYEFSWVTTYSVTFFYSSVGTSFFVKSFELICSRL